MTVRRISIGAVGGAFGVYMSKPGIDVTAAAETDLLFSPNKEFLQVVHERELTVAATARSSALRVMRRIDHPDFGFTPLVSVETISRDYEMTTVPQWNIVTGPFSRFPFGQTQTGFWLVWHLMRVTLNGVSTYANLGGTVRIRLYNIAVGTSGYAVPTHDLDIADS